MASNSRPVVSAATMAARRILLKTRTTSAPISNALSPPSSAVIAPRSFSSLASNTSITPPPHSSSSTTTSTSIGGFPPDIDNYASPYTSFFADIKRGVTPLGTDATKPYIESTQPTPKLKCGIPEHVLRFRTASYGRLVEEPFVKSVEHKVALKIYLRDIPFESDLEKEIFLQIVGPRFRHEKNELMLSSDQFASRIENKRHLVSMLNRIVFSARRLANEGGEEQKEEA
mmetsp:Transcript_16920/g.24566  ORF Transcript_16920/g.24566 Transcript_16920/m.24566 type:complete len:229 (+) Transcript_16920:86-772(+)